MRINILAPSTSLTISNNGANVQGDELVARSWIKSLSKRIEVHSVDLNGNNDYDITISFSPLIHQNCKSRVNILYLQNVFPKPAWPGTVEMFHIHKSKYDAFIFPSDGIKNACESNGLVCQFATDTDLFYPDSDDKFNFNTCFVGNNIRNSDTTNKHILCAEKFGLAIFGNPSSWNNKNCYGKITIEDERKLYSSSKICLNAHLDEHLQYGSFNFRIFNILACKGFIVSDRSKYLEDEFGECMVFADDQQQVIQQIDYYLNNPQETIKYRENGYNKITNYHTFDHRINNLIEWIKTL